MYMNECHDTVWQTDAWEPPSLILQDLDNQICALANAKLVPPLKKTGSRRLAVLDKGEHGEHGQPRMMLTSTEPYLSVGLFQFKGI
jgi:hypothetical protein